MRVIAGTARHLPLKTIESMNTRPTTDRIKETLFNMLSNDIPGCLFMDFFAGSGGIGIEALSRGADEVYFVEMAKDALDCIHENLEFTHLEKNAHIIAQDALCAVQSIRTPRPCDILFMDPPYNKEWEKKLLSLLSKADYIDEYSMIIVEASLETDFSYLEEFGFRAYKIKKYKTNQHVFIQRI